MNIEHVVIIGVGTSATLFFASCSVWLWRRASFASALRRQELPVRVAVEASVSAARPLPIEPAAYPQAAVPGPAPAQDPAAPPTPAPPQAMDWAQPGQTQQLASAEREAFERGALEQLLQTDQGGDIDGATTNFFMKKPAKTVRLPRSEQPDRSERAKTAYFVRKPAGGTTPPPRDKYDFGDGPLDEDAPVGRSDTPPTAPNKRAGPPRVGQRPPPLQQTQPPQPPQPPAPTRRRVGPPAPPPPPRRR